MPIELDPGTRLNGMDIIVCRSRMFQIAGRMVVTPGVEGRPRNVSLREVKGEALFAGPETNVNLRSDGTFLVRNVEPGSYRLRAFIETDRRDWDGSVLVAVRDGDLEGVEIAIRPGTEVTGRVRPESEADQPIDNWVVVFESLDSRNILAEGLTVGEPAAGATVVLIPEPKLRDQIDRFQDTATDQYGRLLLKDIPPGEYQVFAWDDVEDGSWFDPDFLKKYEKAGEAVTIHAKQTESMKVTIR